MLYLADSTRAMIGYLAGYVLLCGPLDQLKVSFLTPLINLRDKIIYSTYFLGPKWKLRVVVFCRPFMA